MEQLQRLSLLIGEDNTNKLFKKSVMIFGCGGVGGYVIEALARSGIGHLILIDNDVVDITNLNRQIISLHSNIGKLKTEVATNRIHDINPEIQVDIYNLFILKDNLNQIDFTGVDYIVDAIDTVSAKLAIIEKSKELNIPIICSMGTGNKLDPTRFKIVDISKTYQDKLAKVIRYELKKRNITKVNVLFSDEENHVSSEIIPSCCHTVGTAGFMIAGFVINELIK